MPMQASVMIATSGMIPSPGGVAWDPGDDPSALSACTHDIPESLREVNLWPMECCVEEQDFKACATRHRWVVSPYPATSRDERDEPRESARVPRSKPGTVPSQPRPVCRDRQRDRRYGPRSSRQAKQPADPRTPTSAPTTTASAGAADHAKPLSLSATASWSSPGTYCPPARPTPTSAATTSTSATTATPASDDSWPNSKP